MHSSILRYSEKLQSQGRYTFSLDNIKQDIGINNVTLKKGLVRLVQSGKILSLRKGFYIIVPPEYSVKGILPPNLFIHDLMTYNKKPYYVALASAAALHGAAHQQPQEFYVITQKPALRPIQKKGIRINFIIKSSFPKAGVQEHKTDTGMIRVSGPELTAFDLVRFADKIGGLNRVVTILEELCEKLDPAKLAELAPDVPVSFIQRLGYLLENILQKKAMTEPVYNHLVTRTYYRIPLQPGEKEAGFTSNNRWRVITNTEPESDL